MPRIHAAANRIPTLRTDQQLRRFPELQDREPLPLDHLPSQTWCGSLTFSIAAKTPLVYGNANKETGSISIPTTTLHTTGTPPQEIPILPATMVKGMLSNTFERITSSRLRIFGNHSDPLTYRTDPAAAQELFPALINPSKNQATLLTGTYSRLATITLPRKKGSGSEERTIPIMMPATLRTKPGDKTRFATGMTNKKLLEKIRPKEGKTFRQIYFDAKLVNNGNYAYWFIYALYDNDKEDTPTPIFDENKLTGEDLGEKLIKQRGYTYLTTDPEDLKNHRSTFKKKMSERVFFTQSQSDAIIAEIPHTTSNLPSPIDRYHLTIQSYIDNWHDELERDPETTRTPNKFIRQHQTDRPRATTPFLAYAVVSKDQFGKTTVDTITPISVGRDAYTMSPLALARRAHVAPAQIISELSPADRLFGFVAYRDNSSQSPNEENDPISSFKGRISVIRVDYAGGGGLAKPSNLRLRPLLSPRPSSARRFLTRTDGTNVNSGYQQVKRSQYFSAEPEQSLGATTYPVDRNAWVQINSTNGFPKKALKKPEDSVKLTSSVGSYLRAGTTFKVTLRFEALSTFELSWLLWLLNPANLVPRTELNQPGPTTKKRPLGYLRLGMGKPLGLGVVQVDLSTDGFRAIETFSSSTDASSLSEAYTRLTGCFGTVVTTTDPTQFQVPKHYLKTPWVEAFQRSCFGYDDAFDVRHFTLDENKENNRTDGKTGLPVHGAGVEPGVLWGSQSGAPIVAPERRKEKSR